MGAIFLSTAYLAPVEYYMYLFTSPEIVVEKQCNYLKQTYRNRCTIATANGLQDLSIPVERTGSQKVLTKDIRISDHGNWRHLHWNAILSAYNSSPFFEYYEHDFRPFFEKKQAFLFDFNESLRELICELIDFKPNVIYSSNYEFDLQGNKQDLREAIHPKKPVDKSKFKPYYQVFKNKFGFQANLSIIDLLFNMGPESILFL